MATINNLSLTRALQADGWWYQVATDRWSRLWDGEMQYGQIRDGKFDLIYPEQPKRTYGALDPKTLPPEQVRNAIREHESTLIQTMDDVGMEYPAPPDVDWLNEVRTALRDQFAMHALQGMLAKNCAYDEKNAALRAYEFADAMMVAREMKRER